MLYNAELLLKIEADSYEEADRLATMVASNVPEGWELTIAATAGKARVLRASVEAVAAIVRTPAHGWL